MTWLNNILVLVTAVAAVFWAGAFNGVRHVLGAQIDLLPPLMVYAALSGTVATVSLLACIGGLLFDSLSANPLGISILPLFTVGLAIHVWRDLILRDQPFAQTTVGVAAGACVPVLTLLLLLTLGHAPQVGWGTLWQLIVMTVGSAVAAPVFFLLFEWLQRTLAHTPKFETSFRPDREIRRGR